MSWNIVNILTWSRVVMIPVFAAFFFLPWEYGRITASLLFGLAAVTDFWDGYLARKLNLSTRFGAFLDPVADKLMVAVALVCIAHAHESFWIALACSVIICREITISALREWMAEIGERSAVKVSWTGKWKTFVQMFAIGFLTWKTNVTWFSIELPVELIGEIALYVATVLTLVSMVLYLRAAADVLRQDSNANSE